MTVLTEKNHTGEFIVSLANGEYSIENAVLASGENLEAGAVVQLTAGEYVEVVDLATDPVAVLYAPTDASAAAKDVVVVTEAAEVALDRLVFPSAFNQTQTDAAVARLVAEGIKVRV